MNLIGFLTAVLVGLIVLVVIKLLCDYMELDAGVRKIVLMIVGLIVLIGALNQLGFVGAPMRGW